MDCPSCGKKIPDENSGKCPDCDKTLQPKWEAFAKKLKAPFKAVVTAIYIALALLSPFQSSVPTVSYAQVQQSSAELQTKQEQKQSQIMLEIEIETQNHDSFLLLAAIIPLASKPHIISQGFTIRFLIDPSIENAEVSAKIKAIVEIYKQFNSYFELQEKIIEVLDFLDTVLEKRKNRKIKVNGIEVKTDNPEKTAQIILSMIETEEDNSSSGSLLHRLTSDDM